MIGIFLDYDGTLVRIIKDPFKAKIDYRRKNFLIKLSKKFKVCIITGREYKNFLKIFGKFPDSLYLITSHGLKIYKGNKLLKVTSYHQLPDLKELRERLKDFKGVFLEVKEGCFAIHTKNLTKGRERVKEIFYGFVLKTKPKRIIEGKDIYEALYGNFDKGLGILELLRVWGNLREAFYLGDDTTDFIGFKRVRRFGIKCIAVGKRSSPYQSFKLRSVEEVYRFLNSL